MLIFVCWTCSYGYLSSCAYCMPLVLDSQYHFAASLPLSWLYKGSTWEECLGVFSLLIRIICIMTEVEAANFWLGRFFLERVYWQASTMWYVARCQIPLWTWGQACMHGLWHCTYAVSLSQHLTPTCAEKSLQMLSHTEHNLDDCCSQVSNSLIGNRSTPPTSLWLLLELGKLGIWRHS